MSSNWLVARGIALIAAAVLTVPYVSATYASDNYFSGGGTTNDWFDAANWDLGIPPQGESTKIYDGSTAEISSGAAEYGDVDLSIGDSDSGQTATLLISGGSLNGTGTGNDIRLGVSDDGSGALGQIIQTSGDVTAVDYVKMSNAGASDAAGSYYEISGGSLTVVNQIEMGRDGGMVQNMIMLKIIGTGPTSVTTDDLKTNRTAPGYAQPTLAFALDSTVTGVTPLQIADEFQIGNSETATAGEGDMYLELSLLGPPTVDDKILVEAGRISMDEQFIGLPDGSDVSALYGGNTYTWTINYYDGESDPDRPGSLPSTAAVVLSNMRVSQGVVPEPASLVLIGLGAMLLVSLRRR